MSRFSTTGSSIDVNLRWETLACALALVAIACGPSATGSHNSTGGAGTQGPVGGAGGAGGAGTGGSAGGPGGTGGTGTGGSAGGATGGGSAGAGPSTGAAGSGAVAPGTCGVFRRFPLSTDLRLVETTPNFPLEVSETPDHFVRRVAGVFAFGPWTETSPTQLQPQRLHWLSVDLDRQQETLHSTEFGFQGGVLTYFNMGGTTRVVLVEATWDGYWTAVLDEGGTLPTTVAKLSDDQHSKFTLVRGNVSLDGQRGLFMTSENGSAPWLAMYASDGTRVGDVLQTTADGACQSVVPTEHGAAFTLAEGGAFHVIEFSAAGSVALDVKIPLAGAECPKLALTDAGFAYLGYVTMDIDWPTWILHRIARDGTVTREPWDALRGCVLPALAVDGDTAIATCAETTGTTIVKRAHGQDQRFPLERSGRQILSEPGSLFLDTGTPSTAGSPARAILDIRCVD